MAAAASSSMIHRYRHAVIVGSGHRSAVDRMPRSCRCRPSACRSGRVNRSPSSCRWSLLLLLLLLGSDERGVVPRAAQTRRSTSPRGGCEQAAEQMASVLRQSARQRIAAMQQLMQRPDVIEYLRHARRRAWRRDRSGDRARISAPRSRSRDVELWDAAGRDCSPLAPRSTSSGRPALDRVPQGRAPGDRRGDDRAAAPVGDGTAVIRSAAASTDDGAAARLHRRTAAHLQSRANPADHGAAHRPDRQRRRRS